MIFAFYIVITLYCSFHTKYVLRKLLLNKHTLVFVSDNTFVNELLLYIYCIYISTKYIYSIYIYMCVCVYSIYMLLINYLNLSLLPITVATRLDLSTSIIFVEIARNYTWRWNTRNTKYVTLDESFHFPGIACFIWKII